MSRRGESGAGTLLMVMLLAAMGLLLLTAMQRQLDMALHITNDERQYLLAFNRAESSLNWGMAQTWALDQNTREQCRQWEADTLSVCLTWIADNARWLMRAEGRVAAGVSTMRLYQRVSPADPEQTHSHFLPLDGGWLDFCPERQEIYCAYR